jgi:hypothetical protein
MRLSKAIIARRTKRRARSKRERVRIRRLLRRVS